MFCVPERMYHFLHNPSNSTIPSSFSWAKSDALPGTVMLKFDAFLEMVMLKFNAFLGMVMLKFDALLGMVMLKILMWCFYRTDNALVHLDIVPSPIDLLLLLILFWQTCLFLVSFSPVIWTFSFPVIIMMLWWLSLVCVARAIYNHPIGLVCLMLSNAWWC